MLEHAILRTPLIPYRGHNNDTNLFLKPENLQIFGSYKIRGIAAAVAAAPAHKLKQGLVTASAGNMAQAVAFAANTLHVPCKIFVPNSAPQVKKDAIRNLGVEVIELSFAEIWEMVKTPNNTHDGLFIHPVFTPGLLEGYGTIGKEILDDLEDVDAVVIPFGLGGLTLGISRVLKTFKPTISIYTCEPSTAAPLLASFQAGHAMSVERQVSFIDAIGTPEVLPEVFSEVRNLVCESIAISPADAMESVRDVLTRNKLLCEGAAGVSLAAAIQLSKRGVHKNIVCILSGGNISLDLMLYEIQQENSPNSQ